MSNVTDLTGQRFSSLIVESRAEDYKNGAARWNCLCDCGNSKTIGGSNLTGGKIKSCGCLRKKRIRELRHKDLTGQKFGRWLVISEAPQRKNRSYWNCRCECGAEKVVLGGNLTSKKTTSCGCRKSEVTAERNRTHGMHGHPVYMTWLAMRQRCSKSYIRPENYFYKGVRVCEEWKDDFMEFYTYMGDKPSPQHSLDRIDVDGNYEPGNVRWADDKEQARNKTTNYWIEYDGVQMVLYDAVALSGRSADYLKKRYSRVYP